VSDSLQSYISLSWTIIKSILLTNVKFEQFASQYA